MPAKTKAEYLRRELWKPKEERTQKYEPGDWLTKELITINHESTVLTRTEALKMRLKDFLYIVRSRSKHQQMISEKMEELNAKQV